MYDEKNLIYIFTMLECTEKCFIYTKGFSDPNEFIWANDQLPLNGVVSMFIAIGEESKKIDDNLKQAVNFELNWSDVAKLRDKISHDYRGVDADILWFVIFKDLPKLKNALIEMIGLINPAKELLNEFLDSVYYRHLGYLR